MSVQEHLADLKTDFPKAKILYAEEIAAVLSKSPTATRRMLDKRQLPNMKVYGGRLGISIVNMAHYLDKGIDADNTDDEKIGTKPEPRKTSNSKAKTPDPTKATRTAPLFRNFMKLALNQANFWHDLYVAMEEISMQKVAKKGKKFDPNVL